MNNVMLYWSLESCLLTIALEQHWAQGHFEHRGFEPSWRAHCRLSCVCLPANRPPLWLCLQWTCWACRWRARCSTSTAWSRTSSCSTSPSWSPVWPACTSGWSRTTHTWSTSRCASTCASTGCSTSTTRTCGMLYMQTEESPLCPRDLTHP